jgi:YD repeat-containing protein
MTHANGVVTNYTYDPASQLLSIAHQLGATTIDSFSYNYDKVGNRNSKADNNGTANYTYDALNRLVQTMNPLPSNPLESFTYDAVGNRIGSNQNGPSIFNQANQLLEDANFTYRGRSRDELRIRCGEQAGESSDGDPNDELQVRWFRAAGRKRSN